MMNIDIIQHAIYHRRNNFGVDESVRWGDYYYLEAVDRLLCRPNGWRGHPSP
jgi:hypothetical protein